MISPRIMLKITLKTTFDAWKWSLISCPSPSLMYKVFDFPAHALTMIPDIEMIASPQSTYDKMSMTFARDLALFLNSTI